MTPGVRADLFLVEHGYANSRTEAQAAIRAGRVAVDGKPVAKPSQVVAEGAAVVYEKPHPYVSRGALKLVAALEHFGLSPAGLTCIDVGASTGGFTEILLGRGARKVYAIDVGHGQLRAKLAADPRVVQREGVNARELTSLHVPEQADCIVVDVSFIGLKLVLSSALKFARSGAWLVALVKPQFEVGREKIGKGGVVKDDAAQRGAVTGIVDWLGGQLDWTVIGTMDSPVVGGDGNREYLVAARKS
ncbi:MAG: TlyA family RNA methyltransferase [Alphaproteobacteria bacterium]|nr:TlyA family RNA methyltransferase [Alphaproteobacteria bacterium]